jgi:SAM-dependent methyltransferase
VELSNDLFATNKDFYASDRVVDHYANNTALSSAERKLLVRYDTLVRRGKMLDIGVGAGRTLPHLRACTASYTGIDYSQPMIDRCGARFPGAHLLCCDVRDLAPFETASFDTAYAIFNGLDELLPDDRPRALSEVARVLRPGGLFLFSSHNIGWCNDVAGDPAIVIERMMGVDLPTYYIGPKAQISQLAASGFNAIEVSNASGDALGDIAAAQNDPWLFYAARREWTSF